MSKLLNQFLSNELQTLRDKGLYNNIDIVEGANYATIKINSKEYINLSSNNYLGLNLNKKVVEAGIDALRKYGAGAGAVRSINGTLDIHDSLEKNLATFKGTEASLVFQSGFNCNMAAISAIMVKGDLILSDSLNHASIIDGIRLSSAAKKVVEHSNMEDLRLKAKEARESGEYNKIMFITDGVFSMDGDVCKLPEIVEIAKEYNLITYVDDAHGSGVMGEGAGTAKHFNLSKDVDLQIGTLSKAVGVVGGYVAGSKEVIEYLKVKARPFLFSTSITPSAAGSVMAAIDIISKDKSLTENLWSNAKYLQDNLQKLGYNIMGTSTPITPCLIGDENLTQSFTKKLMDHGIYAKSIVFPTVPLNTGRIRNMPSAVHSKEMLDKAIHAYEIIGKELSVI